MWEILDYMCEKYKPRNLFAEHIKGSQDSHCNDFPFYCVIKYLQLFISFFAKTCISHQTLLTAKREIKSNLCSNGKLNTDILFLKKINVHEICSKYLLIFTNHHESCSEFTEN